MEAPQAPAPPAHEGSGTAPSSPQCEWQEAPGSPSKQDQWFKTKLCPRVKKGKHCRRGPECPYAHSEEEMRSLPDLSKTSLCRGFQAGRCVDPLCRFAHGEGELRTTDEFYKSKPCWDFARAGGCSKGAACRHAHGDQELRHAHTHTHTSLPPELLRSLMADQRRVQRRAGGEGGEGGANEFFLGGEAAGGEGRDEWGFYLPPTLAFSPPPSSLPSGSPSPLLGPAGPSAGSGGGGGEVVFVLEEESREEALPHPAPPLERQAVAAAQVLLRARRAAQRGEGAVAQGLVHEYMRVCFAIHAAQQQPPHSASPKTSPSPSAPPKASPSPSSPLNPKAAPFVSRLSAAAAEFVPAALHPPHTLHHQQHPPPPAAPSAVRGPSGLLSASLDGLRRGTLPPQQLPDERPVHQEALLPTPDIPPCPLAWQAAHAVGGAGGLRGRPSPLLGSLQHHAPHLPPQQLRRMSSGASPQGSPQGSALLPTPDHPPLHSPLLQQGSPFLSPYGPHSPLQAPSASMASPAQPLPPPPPGFELDGAPSPPSDHPANPHAAPGPAAVLACPPAAGGLLPTPPHPPMPHPFAPHAPHAHRGSAAASPLRGPESPAYFACFPSALLLQQGSPATSPAQHPLAPPPLRGPAGMPSLDLVEGGEGEGGCELVLEALEFETDPLGHNALILSADSPLNCRAAHRSSRLSPHRAPLLAGNASPKGGPATAPAASLEGPAAPAPRARSDTRSTAAEVHGAASRRTTTAASSVPAMSARASIGDAHHHPQGSPTLAAPPHSQSSPKSTHTHAHQPAVTLPPLSPGLGACLQRVELLGAHAASKPANNVS